jgi:hypothetical protein
MRAFRRYDFARFFTTLVPVRVSAIVAMVMLLAACGSSGGGNSQATPTPTASPSPLACTVSGAASASWPGPASRTSTTPPIVSAVAAGDTLTLTFDQGTPAFEVKTQAGTHFSQDPSGKPVDLAGSAGATIVLRGFRGDMGNYTGPVSIISSGPRLLQVYEIGDFEGVVTWAAGLGGAGCANASAAESNLTFHFIALPS